jgi:hypothetical protein
LICDVVIARDVADPLDIGDRGSAEFHHQASHAGIRATRPAGASAKKPATYAIGSGDRNHQD